MNLMTKSGKADFVLTASGLPRPIKKPHVMAKPMLWPLPRIRPLLHSELDPATFTKDADYFHICMNNTIYGTRFTKLPETGDVPLVADISSCILSEPIDVSKFGVLYAGAQKNMGPAGLTVVIIREDLIGHAMDITPTMFNYQTHADNGSMFNTPPCYSIYISMLVLDWIKNTIGGLEEMKKLNEKKAGILYGYLDNSKMFRGTVVPKDRSLMNVPLSQTATN